MKKLNYVLWYFPLSFFVFLGIYTFVKFIFIFFFNAAFEPVFIFDFAPLYMLSGINPLQLIFLSLILIFFEIYLHLNISRKNILLSFIPTSIILSGLGLRIATNEMSTNYMLHYIAFGCFLAIALMDQKLSLLLPDDIYTREKEIVLPTSRKDKHIVSKSDFISEPSSTVQKQIQTGKINEILTLHKETLVSLRTMLKDEVKRVKDMMVGLEKKSQKLDYLYSEIEERRRILIDEERLFQRDFFSTLDKKKPVEVDRRNNELQLDYKEYQEIEKKPTMLDELKGCSAIVKRGILKQASPEFINLFGFDADKNLQNNLINFIAPEGLSLIHNFYLDRLKGNKVSTYNTVLLTRDNKKISVKIDIKRIIYNGQTADFLIIENLDDA
ncbi:MAG: hypothetical protein R6V50_08440 [Thermoplasmatota archaeon]